MTKPALIILVPAGAGLIAYAAGNAVARADAGEAPFSLQIVFAAVLGVLVLVACAVVVWLARQVRAAAAYAEDLAAVRVPDLTRRVRAGEPVDPATVLPAPHGGPFAPLGAALHALACHAVDAVTAETISRDAQQLALRVGRDNQTLLHRQLTMLDEVESRQTDPDELARLFTIDHLAARMRRNVEKHLTLSGSTPARRWRKPVPMLDVLRAAAAEATDYHRVDVAPVSGPVLLGRALIDVTHLLAELIDNALLAAPGQQVRVVCTPMRGEVLITVRDLGPAIEPAALTAANELLRAPATATEEQRGHGLHVAARLAQRRGITVTLQTSPQGSTATVLIPADLLAAVPAAAGPSGGGPSGNPAGRTAAVPGARSRSLRGADVAR
ncbi:anti-sigma regulatory factor (Ser/Thr protein kinase) [Catenuloplanes nepalensis]|uniref:histidine kinase n=1 Tax=Catenuloplanes nepalensis TaxID=587533 RepID=A0ABT9N7X0_9ACTN|nr:ATP-binding protein [Catenuloplanes nepalensis]MDP9799623.1 anti-sigma regulatory factor (Ser/Thr protein kinase) [Catenuloplanes nepalensis]